MADPGYRWSDGHPQRRKAWADHLATVGPVQCGCDGRCLEHEGRCRIIIHDGDTWHLGHNEQGVRGGDTGKNSSPWCTRCNLVDSANVTNGKSEVQAIHYQW